MSPEGQAHKILDLKPSAKGPAAALQARAEGPKAKLSGYHS